MNAPTPYSTQKCPKPRICPQMCRIVWQGSSQGDWNLSTTGICQTFVQTCPKIIVLQFLDKLLTLVPHYSAIGDTISGDASCSAIGFRGKLSLRYPPSKACLGTATGHAYRKKRGCSSDSLRYHRKHSAAGVLLHLSCDRGGIWVGSRSS